MPEAKRARVAADDVDDREPAVRARGGGVGGRRGEELTPSGCKASISLSAASACDVRESSPLQPRGPEPPCAARARQAAPETRLVVAPPRPAVDASAPPPPFWLELADVASAGLGASIVFATDDWRARAPPRPCPRPCAQPVPCPCPACFALAAAGSLPRSR